MALSVRRRIFWVGAMFLSRMFVRSSRDCLRDLMYGSVSALMVLAVRVRSDR